MKYCQYIQKLFTCDFLFMNGLHCIEEKNVNVSIKISCRKFQASLSPGIVYKTVFLWKKYWNDRYKNKVKDIFDQRIGSMWIEKMKKMKMKNKLIFKGEHIKMIWSTLCLVLGI